MDIDAVRAMARPIINDYKKRFPEGNHVVFYDEDDIPDISTLQLESVRNIFESYLKANDLGVIFDPTVAYAKGEADITVAGTEYLQQWLQGLKTEVKKLEKQFGKKLEPVGDPKRGVVENVKGLKPEENVDGLLIAESRHKSNVRPLKKDK